MRDLTRGGVLLFGIFGLIAAFFAMTLPSRADATAATAVQEGRWVRIESRWRPNEFINVEGRLTSGPAQPGWHSPMWLVEPTGDGYVRFRNRWREGHYLHIGNGSLQAGPIQPGWESAMWTLEATGDNWTRIRNRWQPDQYIHTERGRRQAGQIQPGWHSAMWSLGDV